MESATSDQEPDLVGRLVERPRERFRRGHAGEIENHQQPPVPLGAASGGAAEAGPATLTLPGGSPTPQ